MKSLLPRLSIPVVILAILFAWWYPTPVLVGIEATNWAERHERDHAPVDTRFGAMAIARDFLQRQRAATSLPVYIDERSREGMIEARIDEHRHSWTAVLEALEQADRVFLEPADWIPDAPRQIASAPIYLLLRDPPEVHFLTLTRWPPWDYTRVGVPSNQHYPFRDRWPYLVLAFLAVLSWRTLSRKPATRTAKAADSTTGAVLVFTLMMLVTGVMLLLLPHVYGIWEGDMGLPMASSMIGLLLALTGLITSAMYAGQYRQLQRLLQGDGRIAHWIYTPEEWRDFVHAEYGERRQSARATLWMIGIMMLLVGGAFMLFVDLEDALVVAAGLAGVFVLVALAAILAPRLSRRRLLRGPFEAHIGKDLLYLGGQTHFWRAWTARLESVRYIDQPRPLLELAYSQLQVSDPKTLATHRAWMHLRIPVPAGHEAEARGLVKQLKPSRERH